MIGFENMFAVQSNVLVQCSVVIAVLALALATRWVLTKRMRSNAPTQPAREVPVQLDRNDFARPEAAWLALVFSSDTCTSCESVIEKVRVLESNEVGVDVVSYQTRKDLHDRYAIDSVPLTVIADADGVVQASFFGVMSATDLWAAVADVREPGSSPEPHLGSHQH